MKKSGITNKVFSSCVVVCSMMSCISNVSAELSAEEINAAQQSFNEINDVIGKHGGSLDFQILKKEIPGNAYIKLISNAQGLISKSGSTVNLTELPVTVNSGLPIGGYYNTTKQMPYSTRVNDIVIHWSPAARVILQDGIAFRVNRRMDSYTIAVASPTGKDIKDVTVDDKLDLSSITMPAVQKRTGKRVGAKLKADPSFWTYTHDPESDYKL